MSMERIKNVLFILILVGVGLIGYRIGRGHFRDATKMVQIDTLVVRDTVTIEKPVPAETTDKEILYVAVHDTTRIHDTLYIMLQKESKTYRGEDYMAKVSGYNPSLDFIEVYPKTTTITKTETVTQKPTSWRYSIDIGADYGWMWGDSYITPSIGAELGYKRFSLGVRGGVNIGLKQGVIQAPGLYWELGMKYRLAGK